MAYISTQEIKVKRDALKAAFPNFKFSVKRDRPSGLIVVIKSGPLDLANLLAGRYTITRYRLRELADGEIKTTLTKIYDIVTDGQTYHETCDYGTQPSFYESLKIGDYGEPYIMKK